MSASAPRPEDDSASTHSRHARRGRESRAAVRRPGLRADLAGAAVLGSLVLLGGCAVAGATEPSGAGTADSTVTVFAAASLSDAFTTIATDFEAAHPGTDVVLSFDGSSGLATQIEAGAPADVFASADEPTMDRVAEKDLLVDDPTVFATNTLRIVTAPGNPLGIEDLADLADPDVSTVVCAPQVPCGNATRSVLETAHVDLEPVSEENNVTDVLGKVVSGQADAGLVYVTDAASAGDGVTTLDFTGSGDVVNAYPAAVVDQPDRSSEDTGLAAEFVEYLATPEARQVLTDDGFGAP